MFKRLLLLGALALATGAAVRMGSAPTPAVAIPAAATPQTPPEAVATTAAGAPPSATPEARTANWRAVWTKPVPGADSVSLAADGASAAWVDAAGSVRRLSGADGKTIFQSAALPGVNRVLALPKAAGVLAYAHLNPHATTVHLLDGERGTDALSYGLDGAVWSAAAGEGRAVVGTGHGLLYLLPLPAQSAPPTPLPAPPATGKSAKPTSPTPSPAAIAPPPHAKALRVTVGGIPEEIAVASSGDPVALIGTWEDAGVGAWGLDGTARWRRREDEPDRTYDVHLSRDGSVAVAVSSRGPHHTHARLQVWNAKTGQLLWSRDLQASDPRALVSADGRSVAVSYVRDDGGDGRVNGHTERRLALFLSDGRPAFPEKGGVFFAPELVALSSDGRRITVRDDAGCLWTLNDQGRILSRLRLPFDPKTGAPPEIRDVLASDDGKTLLVLRGDGAITLFKATSL